MKKAENTAIPKEIQRLFWDMDATSLDLKAHQTIFIERILNQGTLADWKWLVSTYGTKVIQDALHAAHPFGRSGIRAESRVLAELLIA
jgi:hypothetical protein